MEKDPVCAMDVNVKAFAEYTTEQSGQSTNNDNRLAMQFDVTF
jgi:hypothetical protein